MYSRKLYGVATSTANALAQVVIPTKSRIVGVQWAVAIDAEDDTDLAAEVSYASATELAVNGAQQCISEVRAAANLVTSGLYLGAINVFAPVDCPVDQGQIIYLHVFVGGSLSDAQINALLWIK